MLNFVSLNNTLRCGALSSRRVVHFNARRIRSRNSYQTAAAAATASFRRSFSAGSCTSVSCSPLRYQENSAKRAEPKLPDNTNPSVNRPASGNAAEGVLSQTEVPDPASSPGQSSSVEAPTEDFLTFIFEQLEPYIDTHAVHKQLIESGFTPSQSDEIINLLIIQLNSKLTKLSTIYSQLYELENESYLFESAQQELRVDITRSREQHINEAINSINGMERDYATISDELNNHFIQMKNDIEVAINDQKSENTLMSKKIMLRLQETNHKITTELNMAMRSEIESLRWHLSRWGLIAILMSIFTACGGLYIYRSRNQKQLTEKNEFVPLVIYEPSEFDEDDYHADLDPNAL